MKEGIKRTIEIKRISRAECDRCGVTVEIEISDKNLELPLINKVQLDSLNYEGKVIKDLQDETYYICDDCWNDSLDFFRTKIERIRKV